MTPEYVHYSPLYISYSSDDLMLAYAGIGMVITAGIFLIAQYEEYLSRLHGAHVSSDEQPVSQMDAQAEARVQNTQGGVLGNIFTTERVNAEVGTEASPQRAA